MPKNQAGSLGSIVNGLTGRPTLIVSETDGAIITGAGINFSVVGGKVRFELGTSNITSRGLQLSSSLATLAYKTY